MMSLEIFRIQVRHVTTCWEGNFIDAVSALSQYFPCEQSPLPVLYLYELYDVCFIKLHSQSSKSPVLAASSWPLCLHQKVLATNNFAYCSC